MKTITQCYVETSEKDAREMATRFLRGGPDDEHTKAQMELIIETLKEIFNAVDAAEPRLRALELTPVTLLTALVGISGHLAFDYGYALAREVIEKKRNVEDAVSMEHTLHCTQAVLGMSAHQLVVDDKRPFAVYTLLRLAKEMNGLHHED